MYQKDIIYKVVYQKVNMFNIISITKVKELEHIILSVSVPYLYREP